MTAAIVAVTLVVAVAAVVEARRWFLRIDPTRCHFCNTPLAEGELSACGSCWKARVR